MRLRLAAALAAALLVGAQPGAMPSTTDEGRLYLLPLWNGLIGATPDAVAAETATLRARIGEGGPVRVGFAQYIQVNMTQWPVATEAEALAALSTTIAGMDATLSAARAANIPVALLFLTASRDLVDPAQAASQEEDRRVMQWYDDNSLADGWWTLSRYARQQYEVRRLYIRALGRVVANRMARYPETFVAAAGDGEVELAFPGTGTLETPPFPIPYADYSPFSVAEFRDWLRGEGMYAPSQAFASQAHAQASRFRGQPIEALNTAFGTSFTNWALRYEDWSLEDAHGPDDPRDIEAATYTAPGWTPTDNGASFFDAPRTKGEPDDAWWRVWFEFRVSQVARYNQDFAEWMTTVADPATGLTIPASRWYSYQIPADYLFGHSPSVPDRRYLTSASSWTTADIRPFGGAGLTAFNGSDGMFAHALTLANVAPLVAGLGTRWAILEWNPSVPSFANPTLYRSEMQVIERERPTVLVPYAWKDPIYLILDSGFEVALKEMVDRMKTAPWNLRVEVTGAQARLTWVAPESGAPVDRYRIEVDVPGGAHALTLDTNSRSTILTATGGGGPYLVRVHAIRGAQVSSASNIVRVVFPAAAVAPEAPSHLLAVTTGSTITFNWLAPKLGTRATGYVIEAGSGPGLSNLARLSLPAATTFSIGNVPPGSYTVRVRAQNGSLTGPASNEVVVTSGPGGSHCTPVDAPGTLAFTLAGRQVTFAWDEPARGAAPLAYLLEAGSAPGLANLAVLPLGAARGLSVAAPPGTFYLRLRAIGACGVSAPGPDARLDVP